MFRDAMLRCLCACVFVVLLSSDVIAGVDYSQNIVAVYGTSGNPSGGWTSSTDNGVTVSLRANARFAPTTFGQGDQSNGQYVQYAGAPTGAVSSWAVGNKHAMLWNFDWSVSAAVLTDYTYLIELDMDPSYRERFVAIPFLDRAAWCHKESCRAISATAGKWDHSFGNGSETACCTGVEASGSGAGNYDSLLATKTVVQNSWNYAFFCDNATSVFYYSPSELCPTNNAGTGLYSIRITATHTGSGRSTQVAVLVETVPQSVPSFSAAMAILPTCVTGCSNEEPLPKCGVTDLVATASSHTKQVRLCFSDNKCPV